MVVMKTMGKYIYAIINSNKELFSGPCGTTACEEGYAISYQDISAVVSDSEIVDYTRLPKDAVARHLIRHQQIIEKVMGNFTIIPMRIGTFAYDEGEVRYILSKAYQLIKEILNRILDKIEIDVATTWSDFNSILKEVGEEEEIKAFKKNLLDNSKNVTVDDQMKVGVMVKKALDRKRERYAEEIQKELKNISQDFRIHELMDDKMVANFAFLINKTERANFDRRIEELNAKFAEKLNFRCVGPLPPYSFYSLEIKKLDYQDIDWARRKLGILNESVTSDEIKKAYQRQAFIFHPDKNPDKMGAEEEFDQIKKSYDILLDYAASCNQTGSDSLYFNEDEFKKNAILVKIRD